MRSVSFHAIACALAIAATAAAASASPILTITPSATTVTAGQDFSVDVGIEGVTDLFFFDITLTIDDVTKATFRGTNNDPGDADNDPTAEGPFLPGGADPTFYFDLIPSADSAEAVDAVIGTSGVSGDGVLFTAFFTAIGTGPVNIRFGDVTLFDSADIPGEIVPDQLVAARVVVAPASTTVPEPGTIGLIAGGFAAICSRRRRRRSVPPRQ